VNDEMSVGDEGSPSLCQKKKVNVILKLISFPEKTMGGSPMI
tara:strand:+ start:687 stop:812 length:126 start_codon:yes stop_codon:yes gene_type:complete